MTEEQQLSRMHLIQAAVNDLKKKVVMVEECFKKALQNDIKDDELRGSSHVGSSLDFQSNEVKEYNRDIKKLFNALMETHETTCEISSWTRQISRDLQMSRCKHYSYNGFIDIKSIPEYWDSRYNTEIAGYIDRIENKVIAGCANPHNMGRDSLYSTGQSLWCFTKKLCIFVVKEEHNKLWYISHDNVNEIKFCYRKSVYAIIDSSHHIVYGPYI